MYRLILFLVINFSALGIGSWLMGVNPAANEWYQSVNKASWTPPGWVFGVAWTSIMICFSIFLWEVTAKLNSDELKIFYVMFALQFVLNVAWNPVFFYCHLTVIGLIVIIALTAVTGWFTFQGFKNTGITAVLILPYFLWLLIATSLNAYIVLKN